MTGSHAVSIHSHSLIDLRTIPVVTMPEFRDTVIRAIDGGARLGALFGTPSDGGLRLFAVLGHGDAVLRATSAIVKGSYPSLTPE
jgi:hypothetical protein